MVLGRWKLVADGGRTVSMRATNPSAVSVSWADISDNALRVKVSASAGPPRERRTSASVAATAVGLQTGLPEP